MPVNNIRSLVLLWFSKTDLFGKAEPYFYRGPAMPNAVPYKAC